LGKEKTNLTPPPKQGENNSREKKIEKCAGKERTGKEDGRVGMTVKEKRLEPFKRNAEMEEEWELVLDNRDKLI